MPYCRGNSQQVRVVRAASFGEKCGVDPKVLRIFARLSGFVYMPTVVIFQTHCFPKQFLKPKSEMCKGASDSYVRCAAQKGRARPREAEVLFEGPTSFLSPEQKVCEQLKKDSTLDAGELLTSERPVRLKSLSLRFLLTRQTYCSLPLFLMVFWAVSV